jgi:hypothetical protein
MQPISFNDEGIPAFRLNLKKPWRNVHGWFPLVTPEEDNPDEGELQTFITLSKSSEDPRDPLPIIKPL